MRAAYLCPVCLTVQQQTWANEKNEMGLQCGHRRTTGLLEKQPHAISVEDMVRRTRGEKKK